MKTKKTTQVTRIFFLITTILVTFGCNNDRTDEKQILRQKDSVDVATRKANDSVIKIQARLIDKLDTVNLPAYCGIFKFDITLKYEVIKVQQGHCNDKTILIYHICPREIIEQKIIENNKIYTYKLKRRLVTRDIKVGEKTKSVDAGDYEIIN